MAPPAEGGGPFAGSPAPRGFGRCPAAAPAQDGLLSPLAARRNTVAARGARPLSPEERAEMLGALAGHLAGNFGVTGLLHADGPLRHAEPRIFFAATPITAAFASRIAEHPQPGLALAGFATPARRRSSTFAPASSAGLGVAPTTPQGVSAAAGGFATPLAGAFGGVAGVLSSFVDGTPSTAGVRGGVCETPLANYIFSPGEHVRTEPRSFAPRAGVSPSAVGFAAAAAKEEPSLALSSPGQDLSARAVWDSQVHVSKALRPPSPRSLWLMRPELSDS
ncbi:hypothetical protein VTJ04DRAFT_2267 [Mycothermus thermophilus]|uniref:uncharacterized protein n=1 Tax=Humicola insolens TaxID=85995 RepID=UPI0037423314